jgi:hypothetical protein
MGEQKFQGPMVRIGANPGPGGMALTGYRGIDARQAVITAYSEGEATVGPVGTNQVRLAPHANVDWKTIDPLTGPEYLNKGAAIHLGPVGRGATVEFVRVEKLGVWTQGRVGSAVDSVKSVQVSAPVGQARKAAPQRSVARIAAATLPIWIIGCLGLFVAVVAASVLIVVYVGGPEIEKLGPIVEGEEYYEEIADPKKALKDVDEKVLEGLHEPFRRFVAKPSADRAKAAGRTSVDMITKPGEWDERYFEYTMASATTHLQSKNFFRRLDVIREEYAMVIETLKEAGLPEVLAAVPYTESRYMPELQSWACAKGFWQFMPELANQVSQKHGLDFKVADCEIRTSSGNTIRWTPTEMSPPNKVRANAIYVDKTAARDNYDTSVCLIPINGGCRRDDRTDLKLSTQAATMTLKEAWDDEAIAASGAAVPATILSHNAGYDDSRFGIEKPFNVLPAYKAWSKGKPEDETHKFYGESIKTQSKKDSAWGGSKLHPETQHYAYTITGQHLVAVCYYAKNYQDKFEVYRNYESLLNGYCNDFSIPTAQQIKNW